MSGDGIQRESKWDRIRTHEPTEGTVARVNDNEVFTEELLKEQDGKKVPLTLGIGGPVIGEATLHYDMKIGSLIADFKVEDEPLKEFLRGTMPGRRG